MKDLAVFLSGVRIGTVSRRGRLTFTYGPAYLASGDRTPLSLSMPLREEPYGNRSVLAWVNGLLPADDQVRVRIAERGGVKASNPVALLAVIGLDCPGAVQVCPVDRVDDVTERTARLVEVDEAWISERLARLRRDEASWQVADERWSIGGGQSKFALVRDAEGRWFDPQGSAPTTHILKTGVPHAQYQGLNEHVTLETLRRVGVAVARTEYLDFAGQPALVAERFDRPSLDGRLTRRHAEDLCQALGNQATYERYGGPTARQIVELLGERASARSQQRFVEALMVSYLIGSPDGHARNYSVLLQGDQAALAPLYDVASSLPYDVGGEGIMHLRKLAMSVAGERTFGMVRPENWRRFFTVNSIDPDWGFARFRQLAERLPDALSDTFAELGEIDGAAELRGRFVDSVARSCRWELDRLDADTAGSAPTLVKPAPDPATGRTWVAAHTRGGRSVKGHWRTLGR